MPDDRDWSWLDRAEPPPPELPTDRVVWRVTKDERWAEARVRVVPHGTELRMVVGGDGREETLMQSTVYRRGQSDELGVMSQGTLQNFLGHGWTLESA